MALLKATCCLQQIQFLVALEKYIQINDQEIRQKFSFIFLMTFVFQMHIIIKFSFLLKHLYQQGSVSAHT